MDISVIVPIYGVEIYIERCLRSLFNQTKSDGVEYILVNDCTPDRSMEIAREVIAEFPQLDIKILEHKENRKVAATRQTGLDAAQGEYTIQIDSDDWCEPTMLADMFAKAKTDDADIVVADYYDNDGGIIRQKGEQDPVKCVDILMHQDYKSLFTVVWNKLIRRSLYVENGIMCDNGINSGEDQVIVIMIFSCAKRVSYIFKPYLHYTNNPTSLTKFKQTYAYIHDQFLIPCLVTKFFKERGAFDMYKNNLGYLTLKIKEELVKLNRGELQQYAIEAFPEIDRYILSESRFSWGSRIALYLATHGCRPIANLIYNIVGIYKPQINV